MNSLLAAYFTIGNVNVTYVDVVALAILLIFFIIGLVKGFASQILSILSWVAAVVIAFLLVDTVVSFVHTNLPDVVEWFDSLWVGVIDEQFATITSEEGLREALTNSGVPVFLHQAIIDFIGTEYASTLTIITSTLTTWSITVICFILIFAVAMILFLIIKKIFKAITSIKGIKQIDRGLGGILGLLEGLLILLVISCILSLFPWFNDLFHPVTELGEPVTCYFAEVYNFVFTSQFISDFIEGFSVA